MKPESIIEFADKYFTSMCSAGTQWSFSKLFYRNHIPNKKLTNARKAYANISSDEETVLLLLDDTTFGSSKSGFIMTESNIYYSMNASYFGKTIKKGILSLDDIKTLAFERKMGMGVNIILNGEKFGNLKELRDNECEVLEDFFRRLFANDLEITKESIRESVESKIGATQEGIVPTTPKRINQEPEEQQTVSAVIRKEVDETTDEGEEVVLETESSGVSHYLRNLILFFVVGIACFYFGGWSLIWNKGIFALGLDSNFEGGLLYGARGLAIQFNDGFYGIFQSNRFFYSPLVSWVLFGASLGLFWYGFTGSSDE